MMGRAKSSLDIPAPQSWAREPERLSQSAFVGPSEGSPVSCLLRFFRCEMSRGDEEEDEEDDKKRVEVEDSQRRTPVSGMMVLDRAAVVVEIITWNRR